jgi:hypothetical protein
LPFEFGPRCYRDGQPKGQGAGVETTSGARGRANLEVVTVNNDQLDLVVAFLLGTLIPRKFSTCRMNRAASIVNPGEVIFLEATCLGLESPLLREARQGRGLVKTR